MIITIIIITTLIFIKCIGYIVNEREQNKRAKKSALISKIKELKAKLNG